MSVAAMPIVKTCKLHLRGEEYEVTIRNGWSPEEEAAVAEHYPRHGKNWDGWDGLVPCRTRAAIAARARHIGVTFEDKAVKNWSEDELSLLRDYYEVFGASWDGWERMLPQRSPAAIRGMARRLGVCVRPRWSADEIGELFRRPFRTEQWDGWRRLLPHRTERAIRCMRDSIGIWGSGDASNWDSLIVRLIRKTADYTGLESFEVIKRIWELRFEITEEGAE